MQISSFKIQESILDRSQCVIDSDLGCWDCEMIEELCEILIVTVKAPQAVGQFDWVRFREIQEDLAGLQVFGDFPNEEGYFSELFDYCIGFKSF